MLLAKLITLHKRLIVGVWLTVICTAVVAQENSPRSKYGLGDLVPAGNIINRSMGGISTPYSPFDNQSVNFLNPASYSKLRLTTFDLGFEVDSRVTRETSSTNKFNSGSANISYVMLGVPILRPANVKKLHWAFDIGLRPNTRISYKIQTNERIENVDSVATLFEGNGGSYEFIGGSGISIGNFSIGFNAGYMFGTKDYTSKRLFINDTVNYYKSNHEMKSTFGGLSFMGGTQYSFKLNRDVWLRLAATGSLQRTYNAHQDQTVETFNYDVNGAVIAIDTVVTKTSAPGKIVYPSAYSFGFMLEKEYQWLIGAEYKTQKWSDYRFYGQSETLRDAWTVNVGGQWTPDFSKQKNYWSRASYRLGFYYGKDFLKIDNDIPVFGVTGGIALPIRPSPYTNQLTVINTMVEIGRRGNNSNGLKENFFRVGLGLSLSDLWFQKKKYF
jgi:hypothetical protein